MESRCKLGDCGRFIYTDHKCRTCDSLEYHDSIYSGLSSDEIMKLYKERTAIAMKGGVKDGNRKS